ncbi:MAG: Rne/Rng family ribonuclease [Candidatus Cloacimonetes bacterium]|jgi:ribonuclease G|nr:Rne/Rng family ribonuclease [Candidatus Cloacimonadota bacterium]MDY0298528.1 Rne/Rng family ribonuclease [Candidatus Cloacimonadaceae bacterium]MCB5279632.1 Rne/Rng family ribonuclease [Candidatus Cloacimonadota bacterium]MCK9331982.1 Rne/Rng family ribonuclease [Candidatus Cloacimonadota bacterium]MDD2209729.1 Rne/Rng family ribonuclease [Candidatus Cloacimonadota bacterium]
MRKDSVNTEIIVNVHPLEKRVAVLEDNRLVELFVERKDHQNPVGNIYKGIVKDVLPGMGAAFIEIGLERTAFLHYSDIVLDFLEIYEDDKPHKRLNPDDSSQIGKLLKSGQEIVVQVHKGPIGSKGARLTGQISIPGKYLVLFPNKNKIAISRKIYSQGERSRIRNILSEIKDSSYGLIVRTEADGADEEDIRNEYKALAKTWRLIDKQLKFAKAPVCVFEENALVNYLIRDLFGEHVDRLVIDDKSFYKSIISQLEDISADLIPSVELFKEDSPIFDSWAIEKKIETIFHSRIYLPSGGNIKIEQTEALVAIDINTGSFTGKSNYDETVRKTNLEAAAEAARQIRLRDLSGVIVIDFIDMTDEKAKADVLEILRKGLKRDRAKNKVYPFTELGMVEITRKRMRATIMANFSEPCPFCNGSGRIISKDAVTMRIYRWLVRSEYFIRNKRLRIAVNPELLSHIKVHNEDFISYRDQIDFAEDGTIRVDQFKVYSLPGMEDVTSKYS